MASIDISSTLIDHGPRPYIFKVFADLLNGKDEDTYTVSGVTSGKSSAITNCGTAIDSQETSIDSAKATAKTNIATIVNANGSMSSGEKTTMISDINAAIDAAIAGGPTYLDGLKSTITAEITAIAEDNPISDALTAAKTVFDNAILADTTNFPNEDIWCDGDGQYQKQKDTDYTGSDPTGLKHCDVCDGFGRTNLTQAIVVAKPVDKTYPE